MARCHTATTPNTAPLLNPSSADHQQCLQQQQQQQQQQPQRQLRITHQTTTLLPTTLYLPRVPTTVCRTNVLDLSAADEAANDGSHTPASSDEWWVPNGSNTPVAHLGLNEVQFAQFSVCMRAQPRGSQQSSSVLIWNVAGERQRCRQAPLVGIHSKRLSDLRRDRNQCLTTEPSSPHLHAHATHLVKSHVA
uniref:Uncharacterized protein n=1 Tax=Mesocestoides corti TaxID=53468 RepID=A0A5K3ELF7_MESCO